MRLVIISHTEHYYDKTRNSIVGWGPTITEINHLVEVFDEIYHVAMLIDEAPPASALPYTSDKITFVQIPKVGGKRIIDKLNIVWNAPKVINIVAKTLKKVDCFQFRAPTGIGVYVIPYLTLFSKKEGWFKYAGNWNQKKPPLGYAIQRYILKNQKRKVTINGKWPNQPKHSYTFENPCLTLEDIEEGKAIVNEKALQQDLVMCFVGRLEKAKGVDTIIEALGKLSDDQKRRIKAFHFVGDGTERKLFENKAKGTNVNVLFHGFLPRHKVFEIYRASNLFLLPSTASEGFPKVIAEAVNFGCLPIVSSVSSIAQYIKSGQNGFVVDGVDSTSILEILQKIYTMTNSDYLSLVKNANNLAKLFTFDYYNKRIKTEIIKQDIEV